MSATAADEEEEPLLPQLAPMEYKTNSTGQAIVVMACTTCATAIGSFLGALVIVALPTMAKDLGLEDNVLFCRPIFLLGCLLQSLFSLACGLSHTGTQLIVYRAFSGAATSLSVTGDALKIKSATNICLLIASFALILSFVYWVGRQERQNRPTLIPNSLWSNKAFSSICISVILLWGAFTAFEQIINLFFQEVQGLSALDTALRFLPTCLAGGITNVAMGLLVHRFPAKWIILATTGISCVPPLLMAVADPHRSYWVLAFPAVALSPIGVDGLFTVANLVVVSVFPGDTQALAGGVFNTMARIGSSLGLAVVALVADQVTAHTSLEDKRSPEALMEGYRAVFWLMVALTAVSLVVSHVGLKQIGIVGRSEVLG
ncbi:MAG: hypothetical protein Q9197_004547 [Variospora fuerteventurae]